MNALRIVPALLLSACVTVAPSGKPATKLTPVAAFRSVDVSSGIEATIRPGPAAVKIDADAAVLPYVVVKVTAAGVLEVGIDSSGVAFMNTGTVKAQITGPAIEGVGASGGAQVTATFTPAKECGLEASGGSGLKIAGLACEVLAVDASGGSTIEATGTAQRIAIEASGGATVAVRQVEASHVSVEASGGSEVKAFASAELVAELSGGTNLYVAGRPPVRTIEASGGTQIVDIP